jgi:hypothetical protein
MCLQRDHQVLQGHGRGHLVSSTNKYKCTLYSRIASNLDEIIAILAKFAMSAKKEVIEGHGGMVLVMVYP